MKDFLLALPKIWELYKKDVQEERRKQKILDQGPTEEFIKQLMVQAEAGIEAEVHFPGGATLRITRKAQSMEIQMSGLRTREEYLGQ